MKKYTLTIYTENIVGLLLRITAIFTRRHINIESLTVSETERKGISRFTVVVNETEDMVNKVTKKIKNIIEVIHAEYHADTDLIHSQVALYKVELSNVNQIPAIEAAAIQNNARVLMKQENRIVLEKTGTRALLETFMEVLGEFGEVEYVRSGRIAMTLDGARLHQLLPQLPDLNHYPNYSMDHHNR